MAEKEKKSEHKTEKKHGKSKVKGMHVRKAENGGYISTHELLNDPMTGKAGPEQEHILPDLAALKEHMNHFEPQEEEEQAASAAPAQ